MKNKAVLFSVVLVAVASGCFVFLRFPQKEFLQDRRAYTKYAERTAKESEWAPVQLWWEAPPDVKNEYRARRAARLTFLRGEIFSGDTHVPNENIREFLDQQVLNGAIDYVVIFPAPGMKWGEIFPALDECRKSRVRIVLLNQGDS